MTTSGKVPEKELEDVLTNSDAYVKDILRAFDDGWDARGVEDKKKLHNRIKATVYQTMTNTVEVLDYIETKKFNSKNLFAKMDNPSSMTVLITVLLDHYLSDGFSSVYNFVTELENKSRSQQYSLNFILSYYDEYLDSDCLLSDGFRDISDLIDNG